MAFFNPHKVYPEKPPAWMEETQIIPYHIIDNRKRVQQNRPRGYTNPPLIKNRTFENLDAEPICSQEELVTTENGGIRKTKRTVKVTTTGPRECFVNVPTKNKKTNADCDSAEFHRLNRKVLGLISCVCLVSLLSLVLTILLIFGQIKSGCACNSNQESSMTSALTTEEDDETTIKLRELTANLTRLQITMEARLAAIEGNNEYVQQEHFDVGSHKLWLSMNATRAELKSLTSVWIEVNTTKLELHVEKNRTKTLNKKVQDEVLSLWANINSTKKCCNSLTSATNTLETKLRIATTQLQKADNDTKTDLAEAKTTLRSQLNATAVQLQIADTNLIFAIWNVNTSLTKKVNAEIVRLNAVSAALDSTKSELVLFKNSTEENEIRLRIATTQLQKADNDTKTDLAEAKTTLRSQVNAEIVRLNAVSAALDSTKSELVLFKNSTEENEIRVDGELSSIWSELNTTRLSCSSVTTHALMLEKQINATTVQLLTADTNLISAISNMSTSLTTKINEVSKMEGPIGPRGYNGSEGLAGIQGPTGPRGVQGVMGFNGSQGQQGPPGNDGPAGPKGAGDFSQCTWKEKKSASITPTGASSYTDILKQLPSDKKIVGATCSSIGFQEHRFSRLRDPSGNVYFKCACAGASTGPLKASSLHCIINYWECPLTT